MPLVFMFKDFDPLGGCPPCFQRWSGLNSSYISVLPPTGHSSKWNTCLPPPLSRLLYLLIDPFLKIVPTQIHNPFPFCIVFLFQIHYSLKNLPPGSYFLCSSDELDISPQNLGFTVPQHPHQPLSHPGPYHRGALVVLNNSSWLF